MNSNFLKNNPVFWSRLGFCYDPPIKNSMGKPLVFTENFDKTLSYHRDFVKAGVKVHTCILHLGWMGVDEYDYSLTDRVLESVFSLGDDVYFIPRIKLNVPIDWCRENPEDVFVYYGGPTTKEEIASLVGSLKQDYLGYEAENGYYRAGDYVDRRPNVDGVIARQSFSSKKWLEDAGVALSKLIDRLESSKYKDRIIGYHICYGTSGETILWGRISKKYGDYGINNKRAFYQFGLKKYGSKEALCAAWCQPYISENNLRLPTRDERVGNKNSLSEFFRGRKEDKIIIDYDEFTSEKNAEALNHFAKIVKKKTGKLVGAFYGYSLYINDAAYSGHLALDKLLSSPYLDFFASPKAYARSGYGEPGGEICPAQSINLHKLFVDELDNRTYLATENEEDIKSGFVSKGLSETLAVMRREFAKDLSHGSGFWWMDLGGGWFDSPELMSEVDSLVKLSKDLSNKGDTSVADMLILYDERSMMTHGVSEHLHKGFLREFINETNCSGVISDVYRACDLPHIDLSKYRLIVFAFNFYIDKKTREIIRNIPSDKTLVFSYCAGIHSENGYSLDLCEEITQHKITELKGVDQYDFPKIKAIATENNKNRLLITEPYLKAKEIREMARKAGCHIYSENDGITVYANKNFLGAFSAAGGELTLKEKGNYKDVFSGESYSDTDRIVIPEDSEGLILVKV